MNGSILIVSRNGLSYTKAAVRTALAQDIPCDVLVIDNDSNDGTQAWLSSKTGIGVSYQPGQVSLSACWNLGLRLYYNSGLRDEVLVINNDVELRPDTYRILASSRQLFVTCVSVDSRDRMGTPGDRQVETLMEDARPHPDFSCFMIRKDCYRWTGSFDEEYFPAYVEDCDYHVRMHRANIKALCLDLPFYHAGAQTVKQANEFEAKRIGRLANKNRERFKVKYGCLPGTPEYGELFK